MIIIDLWVAGLALMLTMLESAPILDEAGGGPKGRRMTPDTHSETGGETGGPSAPLTTVLDLGAMVGFREEPIAADASPVELLPAS